MIEHNVGPPSLWHMLGRDLVLSLDLSFYSQSIPLVLTLGFKRDDIKLSCHAVEDLSFPLSSIFLWIRLAASVRLGPKTLRTLDEEVKSLVSAWRSPRDEDRRLTVYSRIKL